MAQSKQFSINDLKASTYADIPRDMEIINEATGEGTGIILKVLSDESTTFKAYQKKIINISRQKAAIAAKTNRPQEVETFEETEISYNKAVAARIVGWEGIVEEYSAENAYQLVSNSESIGRQVLKCSAEPVDFMKNK